MSSTSKVKKMIESKCFKFIWNGKPDKVNRNTLIGDFLSDQLYVAYGYVVVLQIVLSPVLEHNDKQICGTIIIVFIRKQHILSSNC
jgi:hypothetical protein